MSEAWVTESDATQRGLTGADQGLSNLYYSQKLANAEAIRDIVNFGQGAGIVHTWVRCELKTGRNE
jgi:hypothetical protein